MKGKKISLFFIQYFTLLLHTLSRYAIYHYNHTRVFIIYNWILFIETCTQYRLRLWEGFRIGIGDYVFIFVESSAEGPCRLSVLLFGEFCILFVWFCISGDSFHLCTVDVVAACPGWSLLAKLGINSFIHLFIQSFYYYCVSS